MKLKLLLALLACLVLSPAGMIAQTSNDTAQTNDTTATETTDDPDTGERSLVYLVVVEGAITVVVSDRIEQAVEQAEENGAELVVVQMDTPGGYTSATWSINKAIFNSDVPVCVYVAPLGATAGSAGVYITYASHIAAMAPSANIGSAHPVAGGGQDIDSVMNEKVTNDAVAKIRAAAERRGRNAEWGEKAVRESVSITAEEALEKNVVDIIAASLDELYEKIDGMEVEMPAGKKTVKLNRPNTIEIEPTWAQKLLDIITDPNVVFILFSIGGLGLVIELYNPGAIFPGVIGAISLIIAFYASQTLPVNYAAVALIGLAFLLWILEVKITSFGMLTVGGIVSFFLGGLMLIDTVDPDLKVSRGLLVGISIAVAIIVSAVIWLVVRAHKHQVFIGNEGMVGKVATVKRPGMVYVDGALWKAKSDDDLDVGDRVEIVDVDSLTLTVKKKQG